MTDAERDMLRELKAYILGNPVDWAELYRARAIVAGEMGIELALPDSGHP
jgi:hypothetical protein